MRVPGPDGTIAHAEIEIGDSVVMVDDASPEMGTKAPPPGGLEGSPTSLYVYVEDVDATVERAGGGSGPLRCVRRRTSSTAIATPTSSIRSGTVGPSRPMSRTFRPTR